MVTPIVEQFGHDGVVTNAYTFRARSSYVFFGVVAFLLVFLLAEALFYETDNGARLSSIGWAGIMGLGAYLIFLRPKVVVYEEGITIVNPVTTVAIGWDEVEAIETQYSMSVQRDGKIIYAWAAPAPGRHHRRDVRESDLRGLPNSREGFIRPGDDPNSLSGSAAAIARRQWEAFKNAPTHSAAYTKSVNLVAPLLLVLSAVLALTAN